ncbi:MAG: hypothetical protein MUC96_04325 [Myxococcaceae bacterium]|nr:hypothetical protein [Myxococcaceae bacterium]
MNRRQLVLAGLALASCKKKESPETQVRRLIAGCVEAVEKKDLGPLDDALAENFQGGGLGKREAKQLVFGHVFRNQNGLVVFNPQLTVEANETAASFSGVFVFARGKDVNWQEPGDGVTRYDIEGTLERRDGDWKITTADWKR